MNLIIIKALIKTLPWIILGIILRLLYDKYYYRKKIRNETVESEKDIEGIRIISYNNPKNVKENKDDYLGFFYNWNELKRYLNNTDPKIYLNKLFSIKINNKLHYYLIICNYVIEEVTISTDE